MKLENPEAETERLTRCLSDCLLPRNPDPDFKHQAPKNRNPDPPIDFLTHGVEKRCTTRSAMMEFRRRA